MGSVELKIERAKEHFRQVQDEIDVWLSSECYTAVYERNEDQDQHYLRARLTGEKPPVERWALLIGDGVTNLRDSLDHLIYQLSNQDLATPSHPKAAFVVVRQQSSFNAEAKQKLANVSNATQNTIEAFQPYNRPHPVAAPSLLGVLSVMAVTNKHKLLLPVFTVPSSIRFSVKTAGPSKGKIALARGSIEDGSVYFVYETENPEPETTLIFEKLAIEIALTHETVPSVPALLSGRSPTRLLLPALIQEVEATVMAVRASV
jgi:hypothetical protein